MIKKTFSKLNAFIDHSKGQLSIFLGMSLIILMTLLAFIINVGLFVKAKINLQNAVDSAAWAGASVQAKQLTNIAYLNWEMRNVYKEWMFKYYVLGQASLTKTRLTGSYGISGLQPLGDNMSYRADTIFKDSEQFAYDPNAYSKYNLPSICFHFGKSGSEFNICEAALVPGLPRFKPISIPGISEHQEVFLNSIVKTKAKNCSERTQINFGVALMWAYGVGGVIVPGAPGIASNRPGAWPKAFELAIRMRNLETFVNRPAIIDGMCTSGDCGVDVRSLDNQYTTIPINERPIKAYWSAYRNLYPDMQERFTLYEIAPNAYVPNPNTLSTFLIPASGSIAGVSPRIKQYLDLQAYPLNLVTYFSTFSSRTAEMDHGNIKAEASCDRANTAIPVPGYLFGFIKNPEVLTYYAVKGKTKFIGLFYPFKDDNGIEISAYAAAKPFGGRIGPRLFHIDSNSQVKPRISSRQYRSLPYVSGIQPGGLPQGKMPDPIIPLAKPGGGKFFVSSDKDVIGGIPDTGDNLTFAIPNLLYEYLDTQQDIGQNQTKYSSPSTSSNDTIQIVTPATSIDNAKTIHEFAGLYDKDQFRMFAANIPPLGQETVISAESVNEAIYNVRRPTKYESLNYLVPTCAVSGDNSDTVPAIGIKCDQHTILAPFFGPEALHKHANDLLGSLNEYLNQNSEAIKTFISGLQKLANDIRSSVDTNDSMAPAADIIYKDVSTDTDCKTLSIAGKFRIFFNSNGTTTCGIIPLALSLEQYWSDMANNNPNFANYFLDHYRGPSETVAPPAGLKSTTFHTAYLPGPRQGASPDGEVNSSNKLRGKTENVFSRRNFYSVKFVAMAALTKNGSGNIPSYAKLGFYQEHSDIGNTIPDIYPQNTPDFKNPIMIENLSEFGELTH